VCGVSKRHADQGGEQCLYACSGLEEHRREAAQRLHFPLFLGAETKTVSNFFLSLPVRYFFLRKREA
jgi:hypothetical protein